MPRKYPKLTENALKTLTDEYFIYIKGKYYIRKAGADKAGAKVTRAKVWSREPEPATISGLALHLGFTSRQAYDDYERKGKFAQLLRRGRLRIEAEYEKRLHQHSTSGAIFALKSMGWNDGKDTDAPALRTLNIKITESGPTLASTEKEVMLEQ